MRIEPVDFPIGVFQLVDDFEEAFVSADDSEWNAFRKKAVKFAELRIEQPVKNKSRAASDSITVRTRAKSAASCRWPLGCIS